MALTLALALALALPAGCARPRPTSSAPATRASDGSDRLAGGDLDAGDGVDARLERELRLHTLRLEHGDPDERVRARRDLADTYLRRADRARLRSFELEEQRFDAGPDERAPLDRQIEALQTEHAACLERAAASYEQILASSGPEALRLGPEARFGLADIRRQQGKEHEARTLLLALVRDHPDHGLAEPSLVLLGDQAFEQQRFDQARALYERATASERIHIRTYARYKLGWVAYNLDDAQAALEHWTRVVTETREIPDYRALADAAARDCVLAYYEVGRPERAWAFFSRIHPRLAPRLVERLAQHYTERGHPGAAAAAIQARPLAAPEP